MADKKRVIGEKERASSKASAKRYLERLHKQGFERRSFYSTVDEFMKIKAFLKKLRGGKELAAVLKEKEEKGQDKP